MRFEVPQFIDVEDKLFGPLTFTQFVYLAGSGGISFSTVHSFFCACGIHDSIRDVWCGFGFL